MTLRDKEIREKNLRDKEIMVGRGDTGMLMETLGVTVFVMKVQDTGET